MTNCSEIVTDTLRPNDVICQWGPSEDLSSIMSLGKVIFSSDDNTCQIEWDETRKGLTEPIDTVLKIGKIFLVNREVFVGSIATVNNFEGTVTETRDHIIGLCEKIMPGGTKERFVIPKVPVSKLKKIIPCKEGDYMLYESWIGSVTDVSVRTTWRFDNAPSVYEEVILPLDVLQKEKLRLGSRYEKMPEALDKYTHHTHKPGLWTKVFTGKQTSKTPASLSDIKLEAVEVFWLQYQKPIAGEKDGKQEEENCPKPPPSKIQQPKELDKIKVLHRCKDDPTYFAHGEYFRMTWSEEYDDTLLSFSKWQWLTLLKSAVLMKSPSPGPASKKEKKSPIFQTGEIIVVTPLAVETDVSLALERVIQQSVSARDLEKIATEVIPRNLVDDLLVGGIAIADMVRDRLDYNGKYGFVVGLDKEEAGTVRVKWIKNLGVKLHEEKMTVMSKYDLVPDPNQSQLTAMNKTFAISNDGFMGTVKGLKFPECYVILREIGCFHERTYLPHELTFFGKMPVSVEDHTGKKRWQVKDIEIMYPHLYSSYATPFTFHDESVIIAPLPEDAASSQTPPNYRIVYHHDLAPLQQHSFKDEKSDGSFDNVSGTLLDDEIKNMPDESWRNVRLLELFSAKLDILTILMKGQRHTGLEGILFIVDVFFTRAYDPDRGTNGIKIAFRRVGNYKPYWPTSRVNEHGNFNSVHLKPGRNQFSQVLDLIRETIRGMDPLEKSASCTGTASKSGWEHAHLSLMDYMLYTLHNCSSQSEGKDIGSHYFLHLAEIVSRNMKYGNGTLLGPGHAITSAAFRHSVNTRVELIRDFLNGSPDHQLKVEKVDLDKDN